jgi:hypothetical protein
MNPEDNTWYYARDGEQHGPVPFLQIKNLVASGQLDVADLVWNESLDGWIPFRDAVANFAPGLPVGPVPGESPRLPIPADLKRASFLKIMILGAIAFILIVGCGAMFYLSISRALPRYTATGPVPAPSSPFDPFLTPLTVLIVIATLGVVIWGIVVAMIYVHRAWRMLQGFGASITPGIAVGLQFIPVFNLYWNFRAYHNWAMEFNNAVARQPALQLAPRASEGVFLTFCICEVVAFVLDIVSRDESVVSAISGIFSLVGLVCLIMIFYQICNAINFFIEIRDRENLAHQIGP